jgi:hypothetical protein
MSFNTKKTFLINFERFNNLFIFNLKYVCKLDKSEEDEAKLF